MAHSGRDLSRIWPMPMNRRIFDEADWSSHSIQLYSFSKSFWHSGAPAWCDCRGQGGRERCKSHGQSADMRKPRATDRGRTRHRAADRLATITVRRDCTRRASALRSVMANIEGWHVEAIGAYFAFVRHPYPDASSVEVAERLAKSLGIITLCRAGSSVKDRKRFCALPSPMSMFRD